MLDELLARLNQNLSDKEFEELEKEVNEIIPDLPWYPNAGPQTEAYYSKADILLYGGQPGGGKSALLLGCSLTAHYRSLIIRKQFTDLEGVVDNLEGILKSKTGIVRGNRPKYKSSEGRLVSFQGMGQTGELDTGKQGNAFDFIGVDEAAQLPEDDIRLIIGWNRTTDKNQRCRIILASNPPVNSTGDWLGTFFAPWLDPKYPNPAKFGELRYFIFNEEGKSQEVDSKEKVIIDGVEYFPHSRTYIPARLEDNPYLNPEEYKKNLQTIPEPFRSQLLSGNFLAARKDQEAQVIPTAWVQLAVQRWEKARGLPPHGVPMCNIGVDCSGGGDDNAVLAPRYDHHFAELTKFKTVVNEYGAQMAGEIIKIRRNNSDVTLDMGGGYGSGAYTILKENIGTNCLKSYQGGSSPEARSGNGKLSFINLRSQLYWQFREALDPGQDGGSLIELPPDPRLLAGLTAPTFRMEGTKVAVEPKIVRDKSGKIIGGVRKKLGYSPDEADAVVMAWWKGRKFLTEEGALQYSYKASSFIMPKSQQMADKYANRRNI